MIKKFKQLIFIFIRLDITKVFFNESDYLDQMMKNNGFDRSLEEPGILLKRFGVSLNKRKKFFEYTLVEGMQNF
jgi:hypothetical protein